MIFQIFLIFKRLMRVQSNPESNSIVHNTHVDGKFLVTSWYRDGTVVHDISNPENLVQVAYYDSYNGEEIWDQIMDLMDVGERTLFTFWKYNIIRH